MIKFALIANSNNLRRFNINELIRQIMNINTLAETQQKQPSSRLIPVPDWNKHHSWPPIGGLRHLIFNAKTNGFATAFKRVGRRVLIDEAEFFNCITKQNGSQ